MKKIRLDKYLADMGQGTRSEVKKQIRKGLVSVNGEIVKDPDYKVSFEKDQIVLNGAELQYEKYEYYMLNKPAGTVSAREDQKEKTVLDLIQGKKRKDLFPVGRLDKDTEGLLLITNDGVLAHELLSPKKHVDKTYFVKLLKPLEAEEKRRLEEGVDIGDEKMTLPAEITFSKKDRTEVLITIREGRFHQIKRMFHAADNEVVYLKRLSMGTLKLDQKLALGEYRPLTEEEIEGLKKNAGTDKSSSV